MVGLAGKRKRFTWPRWIVSDAVIEVVVGFHRTATESRWQLPGWALPTEFEAHRLRCLAVDALFFDEYAKVADGYRILCICNEVIDFLVKDCQRHEAVLFVVLVGRQIEVGRKIGFEFRRTDHAAMIDEAERAIGRKIRIVRPR